MVKIAEAWRPWRGVAAHLLWAYYHVVKRREGVPVQPASGPAEEPQKQSKRQSEAANG